MCIACDLSIEIDITWANWFLNKVVVAAFQRPDLVTDVGLKLPEPLLQSLDRVRMVFMVVDMFSCRPYRVKMAVKEASLGKESKQRVVNEDFC